MTPRFGKITLLALLASCCTIANASLAALAETVYQGNVCSSRVNDLTGQIDWFTNLKQAQEQAREQNKLVFWMHMLGKIDGAT